MKKDFIVPIEELEPWGREFVKTWRGTEPLTSKVWYSLGVTPDLIEGVMNGRISREVLVESMELVEYQLEQLEKIRGFLGNWTKKKYIDQ